MGAQVVIFNLTSMAINLKFYVLDTNHFDTEKSLSPSGSLKKSVYTGPIVATFPDGKKLTFNFLNDGRTSNLWIDKNGWYVTDPRKNHHALTSVAHESAPAPAPSD